MPSLAAFSEPHQSLNTSSHSYMHFTTWVTTTCRLSRKNTSHTGITLPDAILALLGVCTLVKPAMRHRTKLSRHHGITKL